MEGARLRNSMSLSFFSGGINHLKVTQVSSCRMLNLVKTNHAYMCIDEQLKSLISEPFGFHHLTHTSASQFRSLNNTSKDDLVTEFSAIRAGQKPVAELKGIQAEDLHFRNFSSEDLTERDDPVVIDDEVVSRGATSPSPPRTARNARTVENFSRPVSRMQKAATSPSITPPPRISSRQVVSDIPEPTSQMMDEILGLNAPPTLPDFVYSTPEDVIGRTFSIDQIGLAGAFLDDDDSHAVTTADDSSNITSASVINSYLSDLEDVPEEDETPVWHGNVEQTSLPHSLDHDGPSPAVSISNSPARQSYHKYILAKETSLSLSGPLGSPTLPRFHLSVGEPLGLQAEEQLKRLSVSEDFPPSWDEDIDYCYEHAAESDCNFDWRRNSSKLARGSVTEQTLGNSEKLMEGNAKLPLRSLLHALEINNSVPGTPDLDPGSAFSALTTGTHEAVTPLTAGGASVDFLSNEQQVTQGDYFKPIGPQLLQPAFGKDVVHDAIYEELIVAGEDPDDCPFSLYAPHESQSMGFPTSPRNSYSPLSKCNSEESIILSRAASIVRKHRSSASSASVPELIPSRESTIRESLGSIEHGSFEALTPVSPISRPTSLLRHRRTKSPAAEVMMNLRSPRSSDSIETTEIPYPLILPAHDRAKSASAVHVDTLMTAIQPCGPPFAVRMQSPPSLKERGKRSRASYSLFPLAATAVTATTTPTPTSPRS
jgi:hypothetical protein